MIQNNKLFKPCITMIPITIMTMITMWSLWCKHCLVMTTTAHICYNQQINNDSITGSVSTILMYMTTKQTNKLCCYSNNSFQCSGTHRPSQECSHLYCLLQRHLWSPAWSVPGPQTCLSPCHGYCPQTDDPGSSDHWWSTWSTNKHRVMMCCSIHGQMS